MITYANILGTKKMILSDEYEEIILNKSSYKNYDFRRIGAWRWEGIFDNKELVIGHVFDINQIGIDFGGFKGPIGGYTRVVDPLAGTNLDMINGESLDFVFTSHTLEHVDNVENMIEKLYNKLKTGGKIMVLVPRYTKEVWRAYYAPDHLHTFMLSVDVSDHWFINHYEVPENTPYEEHLLEIDTVLKNGGFKLIIAENSRSHCIFIYGEKNE